MRHYHRMVIYFDGASKFNPKGPAGCGWVIYQMNKNGGDCNKIAHGRRYLGYNVSNNQAEYKGLEAALDYVIDSGITCDGLYIRGDSQIVIKQLDGLYKVRSPKIASHYEACVQKLHQVNKTFVKHTYVIRNRNRVADALANEAIVNRSDGIY